MAAALGIFHNAVLEMIVQRLPYYCLQVGLSDSLIIRDNIYPVFGIANDWI